MDEQKASFLILMLSLVLALVLYHYFGKNLAPQSQKRAEKTVTKEVEATPIKAVALKGEDVVIDTTKYRVVVNSQGGVLKSLTLKEYKDDDGNPMELIPKTGFFYNYAPDNKTLTEKLNSAVMRYEIDRLPDRTKVTFSAENGTFVKEYVFYNSEYKLDLNIKTPKIGVYFGPKVAPKDRKSRYSFSGPLVYDGKKAKEVKLKKKKEATFHKPVWVALQSLYFTVSLIPKEPIGVKIVKEGEDNYNLYVFPEGKLTLSWAFAGPKKYDLLKSYGIGLEENIRFGMFGFISKPLLQLMNFLYRYVHNYGVAIIILTIIIKIIFHPLTVKSYKSMNKMKEIQPLIQQIREAYKDDPNKMNQEIMALYKKYKVNPFGGCLPMLLQIPVFFALYKLLMVSIELRHAPFILWITDLSAKDPYYITPIIMGVTMLIQQLLTPTQDPSQGKFMLMLPIIFTVIFLNFPSGLVLYFLVNNIITIGEQLLIKYVYK